MGDLVTLYVSDLPPPPFGLPELSDLFQKYDGFSSARIRQSKNQVFGFVDFSDAGAAQDAIDALSNVKLWPELDRGLKLEFARTTGRKRVQREFETEGPPRSRARRDDAVPRAASPDRTHGLLDGGLVPNPYLPLVPQHSYGSLPLEACCNLFVEGVPDDAQEREIGHVFRPYPGFAALRVRRKDRKTIVFADFETREQAYIAMNNLQGYRFDRNELEGLRLSFARPNRMDRDPPRDVRYSDSRDAIRRLPSRNVDRERDRHREHDRDRDRDRDEDRHRDARDRTDSRSRHPAEKGYGLQLNQKHQRSEDSRPSSSSSTKHLGPPVELLKKKEEERRAEEEAKKRRYSGKSVHQMTAEEREAKVREMEAAAHQHEDDRLQRIREAEERDKQVDADNKARVSGQKPDFIKTMTKGVFDGDLSVADKVQRQAHYRDRNVMKSDHNSFRR
eukprot:GILK01007208.1.p1 GENE.GILK01007208.1~~GILK01007208.1.p1  ORF type:complete len:459 (-),score=68.66 GILK01007208.1:69-1409(-)